MIYTILVYPPPPRFRLLGEGVWANADGWGVKYGVGGGVNSSRLRLRVGRE